MANSVTGYAANYGTYPTSIQGFTSPTQISSVTGSYNSQYDVKPYSHAAMISLSAPAPQYSSHYNYTQPTSSLAYNQQAHSTAIYNTYSTQAAAAAAQSHLQQGTSIPVAAAAQQQQQQLAAAVSIQRGYQQSPPYSNQTGAAAPGYSSTLTGAAATQAVYEQYKQQAAVYEAQAAAAQVAQAQAAQQQQQQAQQQAAQQQAAQQQAQAQQQAAQQQAQAQQVYQHKKDIIDNYSSGGNRLQANIIPHNSSSQQSYTVLPSKSVHMPVQHQVHSPPTPVQRSSNYSTKLDAIQSFSSQSAPPKPPPHRTSSNTRLPLSSNCTSSSSSSILRRTSDPPLPHASQHMFRKNVNMGYKIPFQKNIHQHVCKICKVSCASMKTFKDHEEGQRHKKRVAQLEAEKKEEQVPPTGVQYKCVLCDVTCTGEETFNAHRRGVKHYKAEKLFKDLGNEIPAPIIRGEEEPKPDVPIVGAHLIETKTDPARSKKIIYHCKMCDCSFNDEYAKDLHLKGRRHRLNYKKTYDPNLKVDIQPSKREKIAEQKARRRAEDLERRRNMVENRRHLWEQNRWRAEEEWREWAEARSWHQYEAMKIQQEKEYEERCTSEKEHCKKLGLPEPTLPPPPHLPPPPPRINNARFVCPGMDEFLMIQKQTMVSPSEENLDTLQDLVTAVDQALRSVSDTLCEEAKEQITAQGINNSSPARIISTMHKTGNLTKAILLNDHLSADIAVLCSEKPTQFILKNVCSKFKELYKCGEKGKVSLVLDKARFVVTQGDNPKFIVNIKLTSPAFEVNVSEDERRAECVAKVLERAYCLSTMADVNEAGWYKIHIKPNTPAVIVLRILSSLRQEPDHQLKDLTVQALQVLIFLTIKTFGPIKNVAPTLILRRFFEIMGAGYLLTEELLPPWNQNKVSAGPVASLVEKLDLEQREAITVYAQHSLRCIALGHLHKVLLVPPPPRPSPPAHFPPNGPPPATTRDRDRPTM